METNKYYTPSIEEFHVGFELEIKTHELRPWEKHTWIPGDQAKSVSNYLDQIRVKYLDSEDIESLGFMQNSLYSHTKEDWVIEVNTNDLNDTLGIYCVSDLRFKGRIKNKSELKRVLKMIGAIEQ